MTAEPGFRISSDATFLSLHSLQAVSGAYSVSWPYLGPIQPPGRSRGSFSLQTVSGAYSASRPYLRLIQPPGCMWVPFILLFNVYPEICFSGVKGLRFEVEKPCQFSAKVKNTWSFISAPPCVVMASCLIRHRDRRTLSLMRGTVRNKSCGIGVCNRGISEFPALPECYAVSIGEEPPTFRKMLTSVDLPIHTE